MSTGSWRTYSNVGPPLFMIDLGNGREGIGLFTVFRDIGKKVGCGAPLLSDYDLVLQLTLSLWYL